MLKYLAAGAALVVIAALFFAALSAVGEVSVNSKSMQSDLSSR